MVGAPKPSGNALRKPGPSVFVAVRFAETAAASLGMPHEPVIGKFRGLPAARLGGPKAPLKPFPRVSASRHGVTATKKRGAEGGATDTVAAAGSAGRLPN